jgi:transcription elongation factor GreB
MAEEKEYITPLGFKRLQAELRDLRHRERPEVTQVVSWAASNGDRSENADYTYGKKRLREIDKRIHYLVKRLEGAQVVNPAEVVSEVVRFGATVTYQDELGAEKLITIVGVDEIDLDRKHISWRSPIARALIGAKVGDFVTVHSPKGAEEIEIISVVYQEIN